MQYSLHLKLQNDGIHFFGPGVMQLLLLIEQGESLNQAAASLGMAYSKAWRIIKRAEAELGFDLILRKRGGTGGGGSSLTDKALTVMAKYQRFEKEMYQLGDRLFNEYFGEDI